MCDRDRSLSIIIISSPAASNPSLDLLDAVINSFGHISGLEKANIFIILDGYRIAVHEAHTKRGRVTAEMAAAYEQYYVNLLDKYELYVAPSDMSDTKGNGGDTNSDCSGDTGNESAPAQVESDQQRVFVKKSDVHLGFAHAVKLGLTICNTKYCLICQHDRMFVRQFPYLDKCIEAMETNPHIRYIGWPSTTNCCHEQQVKYRYGLDCLTSMPTGSAAGTAHVTNDDAKNDAKNVKEEVNGVNNIVTDPHVPIGQTTTTTITEDVIESTLLAAESESPPCMQIPLVYASSVSVSQDDSQEQQLLSTSTPTPVVEYKLQPLIFWFDSQHLCCVERYLEIYKPFTYMPKALQQREKAKGVSLFLLRSGDFIEDRFGQAQRNLLCKYKHDIPFVLEIFKWFGSYLVWKMNGEGEENDEDDKAVEETIEIDMDRNVCNDEGHCIDCVDQTKDVGISRGSNSKNEVFPRRRDPPASLLMKKSFSGPVGHASSNLKTHIYQIAVPFVAHLRGRQSGEQKLQSNILRLESLAPPTPSPPLISPSEAASTAEVSV